MSLDEQKINGFKRLDAWRAHPLLNKTWRKAFPGFGIAVVAFGAFVAIDQGMKRKTTKTTHGAKTTHEGDHHGKKH